ncbi:MAG: site-specific DNA-methyltransferase [Mariprofundaceae bacterium]|nr:site-specific DNA-methyltransferase [Mariprofundaceae bacterium]
MKQDIEHIKGRSAIIMQKLDLQTVNFTDENIEKLAVMFPHCVTEERDEQGQLKKGIDFDLLKQELSANIVDGQQERYQINWPGKRQALITANTPINKTLRPCREESVDFDSTQNLYIEGDNLDALKILQETYLGKVKMIYIDPPYNTGKDFVYKDNFTADKAEYELDSEQRDEDGGRLVANPETNGRYHSDWLSMMYPRLKLARNLLKDDGVIFISIDDNEVHNLRKICDEIFGEDNYLTSFMWKRKKETSNDSRNVAIQGEYILSYAKSDATNFKNESLSKEYIKTSYKDSNDEYPLGKWRPVPITVSKGLSGGGYEYPITTPSGKVHNRIWAYPEASFLKLKKKELVYWGLDKSGVPQRVMYAQDSKGQPTTNYWNDTSSNKEGKKVILDLFGGNYFDTTKPLKLIMRLSSLVIDKEDIILDFFSGSATTAHAVMQLNAEDASTCSAQVGNRKFIMVQLPEITDEKSEAYKAGYRTIAEIGKERIRRAGKKIKEDHADKAGIENLDIGFRVLKIDSSNMNNVYYSPNELTQASLQFAEQNIKADRTAEDLLFQVLLDWGVDLSFPIVKEEIEGKAVYFVGDNAHGDYELAACFDDGVDEALVKALAKREVMRVVFKDTGFVKDEIKDNVEQIFKQLSPETEVRAI